jgi:hypothetical protein
LASPDRERVDAHLDECLACLGAFTELRDCLHGLAAPPRPSRALRRALDDLIGDRRGRAGRAADRLRRALIFRIPAWAVAGAAAGVLLAWGAIHQLQQPSEAPPLAGEQLAPAHSQTARVVSGVVSAIRDVMFTWGPPTVRPGDAVEIEGVFTAASQGAAGPVYQGVATQLRRAR